MSNWERIGKNCSVCWRIHEGEKYKIDKNYNVHIICKYNVLKMNIQPLTDRTDLNKYHFGMQYLTQPTHAILRNKAWKIERILNEFWIKNSIIMVVGSDARGENPIFLRGKSPPEIIVSAETGEIITDSEFSTIINILKENGLDIHEFKGSDSVRIFYRWNENAVFPTRIYDAVVAQNFQPSPSERKILFHELKTYNSKVITRFTEKVKIARKAMVSGVSRMQGKDRVEIDFSNNILHYNTENFQNGVKTGPLRHVQYGMMKFIIDRVRWDKAWEVDLMLPSNILDRIDMLSSSGILPLSRVETEDLKFAYGYFLYMHHMLQLGNIETGQTVFEISIDDMKDMKQMILDLEKIIEKLSSSS